MQLGKGYKFEIFRRFLVQIKGTFRMVFKNYFKMAFNFLI